MKKDSDTYRAVIKFASSGYSLRKISRLVGHPATTIVRILKRAEELDLSWAKVNSMTRAAVLQAFEPPRRQVLNYTEPDWESIYLQHERKTKPLTLQILWEDYSKTVPESEKILSYKSFCKNYKEYVRQLPAHLKDVSMTFFWNPGEVVMIDYSGDGVPYVDRTTGKKHTAQIFVGVLACSDYIYCCATPDQTRNSWLDAIASMLKFFDGVPQYIFLDNCSSLVIRADKYNPKVAQEMLALCSFFGTIPMPTRPNEPRDKALVEGAVGIIQRRILNPLAGSQFFSIDEINQALMTRLSELNARPMVERLKTRQELYEEERPFLAKLPPIEYEKNVVTKILKVRKDYRIRIDDRRFSVPYQYVGRKVKVVIHPRQGILECFDLLTGERITSHHYGTTSPADILRPEHMPEAHVAVVRSVDALIDMVALAGPHSRQLAQHIARHCPTRVTRKYLNGMSSMAKRLGPDLFEECAAATIKRPEPTYDALVAEIEDRVNGPDTEDKRLSGGAKLTVAKAATKNIRGADHYRNRLQQGTRNELEGLK